MRKKDLFTGIIFIFILGSVFHFLYELSGENIIVGLFCAINESVWEHTKLLLIPTVLWYFLYYNLNKTKLNKNSWFSGMIICLVVSIACMPLMYYFYKGAFGAEHIIIDIFIFLLSAAAGMYSANIFYKKKKTLPWALMLLLIISVYILFTFWQPNIPLFISA